VASRSANSFATPMLYTRGQSLAGITKLVETFHEYENRLRTEAQIENNYICPLFRFLNWNIGNSGLRPSEYEFVLQRTHRYGKRPDYLLQLDGQRLLLMDAKQVKYDGLFFDTRRSCAYIGSPPHWHAIS
jgi:hypothetical protein